ncbi:MAG: rod shape-determining protein MreD [Actinomycetota bacterium]|nr:rod shape-determining protein MreD [Actinomycetota bacterium]
MEQPSVIRAAIVVALAALLDAVVVPYLTFGFVSPRLTLIAIVFAASPLRDLQAVLLGFFGGILLDALGSDLFGVGALGGLLAAMLASRASAVRRKGTERVLLAQVVAIAVAGYDLIGYTARWLAGLAVPQLGEYAIGGVLPDALINALLAFLVGGWLLNLVNIKIPHGWEK